MAIRRSTPKKCSSGLHSMTNFSKTNKNKIATNNCSIVIMLHLFGHSRDIRGTIKQDVTVADDVTQLVFNAVHKKDPHSLVSDVYMQLRLFFPTVCRSVGNLCAF